jgi:hypothetical protein
MDKIIHIIIETWAGVQGVDVDDGKHHNGIGIGSDRAQR